MRLGALSSQLLLGSHLRRNQGIPESSGELVASLARLALANVEHPSEVELLLQRLAVAAMDRGGGVVPSIEIFSHSDLTRLTDTGLVVNRDSTVGFILPVFAEWFAALGLSSELISINEISSGRSRLEKWRDDVCRRRKFFESNGSLQITFPSRGERASLHVRCSIRGF